MGGATRVDPALTQRREMKKKRLQEAVARELSGIKPRKSSWSPSRCAEMDERCVKEGKRCVMWSDAGTGWYVLINWDWSANRPRSKEEDCFNGHTEGTYLPGYYEDLRKILRPPLLDGSVPPDRLAEWIDQNTISVHHQLLDTLH